MNDELNANQILKFGRDTTKRISFRSDDVLIHLRRESVLNEALSIIDLWELKNGDHATITNRLEDFPPGFRLHPSEVCGPLVYKMIDQFNRGDYPPEPIDSNSLWRVREGDVLVWIGNDRPDIKSDQGLLQIFIFSDSALLYGESNFKTMEDLIDFGSVIHMTDNEKRLNECKRAIKIIESFGIPDIITFEWSIG